MAFKSRLDETMDRTDEYRYRYRIRDFVRKLEKCTNFRYEEIEYLSLLHHKMKDCPYGVSRCRFIDFLHTQFHMTDNFLLPYIYNSLTGDVVKYINREQFVRILSLILCGSLDDKIQYCYRVYSNSDNITRKRVLYLMEKSFWHVNEKHELSDVKVNSRSKVTLNDIVDLLFRKIDLDRDGVISFDEYRNFVLSKPESLELFGSCLPSRTSIFAFLATIRSNIRKL